ncbi:MAG: hypothetical protein KIS76_04855 [Pyrinomonadaceae bacterium]|nr:hypothetical protein [Pyrinomonadaceae bacterium]
MAKKKSPSLTDFARNRVNQSAVSINLIALIFLIAVLFIAFATEGFGNSTARVFSIFLTLAAIFGVIVATGLILKKTRNNAIEKGNMTVPWSISDPESQKHKLNWEVREIAALMDIPEDQYSDLLLAYIVAEDLSLRQIQQEARQPLIRHAKIGETEFDAILLTENLITCVDVTFLVKPDLSDEKIDLISAKMQDAKKVADRQFPNSNLKLLYVVVTQLDALGEAELRSKLTKDKFAKIPVNYFEIAFYGFEELQQIYTV